MDASRRRPRSEVEWCCGIPTPICLQCGPSIQESIAMNRHWYRHIQFPVERQRGLDAEEDWWSPGEFTFDLESGSTRTLALTSEAIDRLDVVALAKREKSRRDTVRQAAPAADSLAGELWCAAEMYLSERGTQTHGDRRVSLVYRLGARHVHLVARPLSGYRSIGRGLAGHRLLCCACV